MAKIYNPTINSYIKEFDGNRYLEIPAGETREFTRIEADFLLKKFEWLIEANDYVPTELRSDERSDIEIFKKYWRRFKNNIGLRRNKHGNKYIIIGSKKFEIPNSETRNALGYDISDFPEEERLLDELDVGPSVTNVFNARLIRLKANPNPVYIVFEFPRLEKRHVPDQATLNAIRREQNEVDTLDKKEFDEIPTGEPIRQKSEWDTKGYVQITNKQDLESNIFNINKSQLHFGTGDNIRNKGKGTLSPKEQWWKQPDMLVGMLMLSVAIISIPWWPVWYQKLLVSLPFIASKPNTEFDKNITGDLQKLPEFNDSSIKATSTPNIVDILSKSKRLETSYEKQIFFKDYIGKKVYGVGTYIDFYKVGETLILLVDVEGSGLGCILTDKGENLEQRVLLFKKGQIVSFVGLFTNMSLEGSSYRTIDNCSI